MGRSCAGRGLFNLGLRKEEIREESVKNVVYTGWYSVSCGIS